MGTIHRPFAYQANALPLSYAAINIAVFKHLKSRNTRYIPHFKFAVGAGVVLLLAGIASIVHAVLPNLFTGYSERKTQALARLSKIRNEK